MNTNYLQSLLDELFSGEIPMVSTGRGNEGRLTPSQVLNQENMKNSFQEFFGSLFGGGGAGTTGGSGGGTSATNNTAPPTTAPPPKPGSPSSVPVPGAIPVAPPGGHRSIGGLSTAARTTTTEELMKNLFANL